MQLKRREDARAVLAPKVTGTAVLKQALAGLDLDFFVMFSSLVSSVGGTAQVDYCAASNFQDAFAHAEQRGALARRVLSIDWGAWRGVGRAFQSAIERGARPEDALSDGIAVADGLAAFERALASPHPQLLVSPLDVAELARKRSEEVFAARRHGEAHQQSDTSRDLRTPTQRVIASIWCDVLGVPHVGVDDNFFDLGADSVITLEFVGKARKAGLRFTNRQVFEHQTVGALAALLEAATEQA
jgi:aryl carrier-like protein